MEIRIVTAEAASVGSLAERLTAASAPTGSRFPPTGEMWLGEHSYRITRPALVEAWH